MPLFGSHMPIAGGLHRAVEAAVEGGMETVQMFTSSPNRWAVQETEAEENARQWKARDFTDEEVRRFREALAASGLQFATAHDSYLINLASPDEALYRRSVEAFVVELQRAEQLGLRYLVMHPGAHVNSGEDAGLVRVAHALDEVHSRCPDYRCQVLIETTAGQGTTLGRRFEELARLRSLVACARPARRLLRHLPRLRGRLRPGAARGVREDDGGVRPPGRDWRIYGSFTSTTA